MTLLPDSFSLLYLYSRRGIEADRTDLTVLKENPENVFSNRGILWTKCCLHFTYSAILLVTPS
eukprot:m.312968 g.312968  ORF g.312968 m.312968 type:complete len:63 (+) comp330911_c0_seq1:196-384(+)